MKIDLSLVPLRQNNMEAWEILLSESQERMLVCIKKGKEHIVEEIFAKWDLNCARIGEVIDEDKLIFSYRGEVVAEVPAESLVLGGGAPVYEREYVEPEFMKEYKHFDINSIPEEDVDLHDVATFLTGHPNIASKRWVYEQYDSMVRTVNMTTNKPSDAGMVNVKGTNTALALTTDCNSRYVKADPEKGTAIAVAEAARNIACTGAKPVAITDCMNFGSPYNPQAYWQFVMSIKGMGEACRAFDTPVTGGNVSFYNQTTIAGKTEPVDPTPVIGMLGILPDKANHVPLCFDKKGDVIYLIGESADDINCSEYLYSYHRVKKSPAPKFDLDFEVKLSKLLQVLAAKKLVKSMHDVSDGGLYITLLEAAMPNNLGFDITTASEFRTDAFLFGESQGRVVVSMNEDQEDDFVDFMMKEKIPFSLLGHVTKGELRIDDESFGFIKDAKELYDNAISKIMEK